MMRELTPRMVARYTQVDYHRELALVAATQLPNPANRGTRARSSSASRTTCAIRTGAARNMPW